MKRKAGIAKSWGMEAYVLTPEECAEKSPLIDPSTILGGLYVPTDGIAKPLRAVAEMIKETQGNGVQYYGNTEVTGIEIEGGQVKEVETSAGKFEADLILCCAGFWGPKIGEMAGVTIPLQPIAHQYIYSNDVPELADQTEEVTTPIVRDQDNSMYFRPLFKGVGIGSYQHRVLPVEVSEIAKYGTTKEMPSVKPFTPEDFVGKPWEDAQRLIPGLKEAGWNRGMNGIFSFTPDGMPLLGESQKVRGFWVAEAIWVTQSAGVGRQMAEWIVNGAPTIDLELAILIDLKHTRKILNIIKHGHVKITRKCMTFIIHMSRKKQHGICASVLFMAVSKHWVLYSVKKQAGNNLGGMKQMIHLFQIMKIEFSIVKDGQLDTGRQVLRQSISIQKNMPVFMTLPR